MRAIIFFKTELNRITDILFDNGILTVLSEYLSGLLKELLERSRHQVLVEFLTEVKNLFSTSNQTKGLLLSKSCLTVIKKQLLEKSITKVCN